MNVFKKKRLSLLSVVFFWFFSGFGAFSVACDNAVKFERVESDKDKLVECFRKRIVELIENEKKSLTDDSDCNESCCHVDDSFYDLEKLKPLADRLFEAMNSFVNSSNCSAEDFDDYIIKNMAETGGQIKIVNRKEFENLCLVGPNEQQNKSAKTGFVPLRRNFSKLNLVNDVRNGVFLVDGHVRGNFYYLDSDFLFDSGHGFYLGNGYGYGSCFTTKNIGKLEGVEVRTGDVVDLAYDKAATKFIGLKQLELIKLALLYYHPEIGDAYKFCCDLSFNFFNSYPIDIYEKAFEKAFGIKFADVFKEGGVAQNLVSSCTGGAYSCNYFINSMFYNGGLAKHSSKFSSELENLMKNNRKKAHFKSKEVAVLNDFGLMAKFLGYDAVYKPACGCSAYYVFVNPKVLVVCGDGYGKPEAIEQLWQQHKEELAKKPVIGCCEDGRG